MPPLLLLLLQAGPPARDAAVAAHWHHHQQQHQRQQQRQQQHPGAASCAAARAPAVAAVAAAPPRCCCRCCRLQAPRCLMRGSARPCACPWPDVCRRPAAADPGLIGLMGSVCPPARLQGVFKPNAAIAADRQHPHGVKAEFTPAMCAQHCTATCSRSNAVSAVRLHHRLQDNCNTSQALSCVRVQRWGCKGGSRKKQQA